MAGSDNKTLGLGSKSALVKLKVAPRRSVMVPATEDDPLGHLLPGKEFTVTAKEAATLKASGHAVDADAEIESEGAEIAPTVNHGDADNVTISSASKNDGRPSVTSVTR